MNEMKHELREKVEAAVFRRLLEHLSDNNDVQNIDLMNLAGFCRNCLSKWYVAASSSLGEDIEYEEAREYVYGVPYSEWKEKYQKPATQDQLEDFNSKA